MTRTGYLAAATAIAALAAPAAAEVKSVGPQGFEVVQSRTFSATPEKVYAAIVQPSRWWSSQHTLSGDAANLSLEPRAGGCFCEKLPNGGSAQHMTVVLVSPGRGLRLSGALGTLQTEGAGGALTFGLRPAGAGTTVSLSYIVGGYFRDGPQKWATGVDKVLGEQIERLKLYVETGSPTGAAR